MKTTKGFVLAAVLCATSIANARAGDKTGNGGNAVVCGPLNQPPERAIMLDYYEAMRRQLPLKPYSPAQTTRAIVADVLDRMATIDPERVTQRYRQWASDLLDGLDKAEASPSRKNDFVQLIDDDLNDVHDSDEISLPSGCRKVQVAVFVGEYGGVFESWYKRFAEDSYYTINYPAYRVMDSVQRAWLVLHEVNYREVIMTYSAFDSVGARYLNGKLFERDPLGLRVYLEALRQSHIPFYVVQTDEASVPIVAYGGTDWEQPYQFDENDRIAWAPIATSPEKAGDPDSGGNPAMRVHLKILGQTMNGSGYVNANPGESIQGRSAGWVTYDGGRLKALALQNNEELKLKDGTTIAALGETPRLLPTWEFAGSRVKISVEPKGSIVVTAPDGKTSLLQKYEFDRLSSDL